MKPAISGSSPSRSRPFLRPAPDGVSIRVRVQPRASRNEICGVQGSSLKIKLTAPPVEGEANAALIGFLSDILGIRKSAITILAGGRSRDKRVKVNGAALEELEGIFDRILGSA